MPGLSGFWPLVKILGVFALMIGGIRYKLGLWQSILAGALCMGLLFGMGPLDWIRAAGAASIQEKTVFLGAIVGLILVLSDLLENTGQSSRLMANLSGYLKHPRLRLVFFPALIGLLPMPGGAVFSAPMVKTLSENMGLANQDKVMLNYWFRHLWEYCWPLYPGIILASSLANISIGKFLAYIWPGTLVMIVLGWVFFLRPGVLRLTDTGSAGNEARDLGLTLRLSLPLITAIGGAVVLETLVGALLPGVPVELGVLAAFVAAISLCAMQNRGGWGLLGRALRKKHLVTMLMVVVSIFVFKETMQRAGVVEALSHMAGGGVALLLSTVLLPFLVGMVGGISIAFIGATFPLILGLLAQMGMGDQLMAYMVLGMFSGFTGVMFSPLHICFILTCQYFGVDLYRVLRRLIPPCVVMFCFGVGYFLVLR